MRKRARFALIFLPFLPAQSVKVNPKPSAAKNFLFFHFSRSLVFSFFSLSFTDDG